MANKRPKPIEMVSKLRQVEVLMGQGMSRLDARRQIGVVEQTYYRWRKNGAIESAIGPRDNGEETAQKSRIGFDAGQVDTEVT